ncbi:MAG: hypothetical protein IKQ46_01710 [Bacteroidales bacterium]|jgi:uncharacterized membrane protein YqiK|nr:hypothetical protein [Bacteroidales bacterium]
MNTEVLSLSASIFWIILLVVIFGALILNAVIKMRHLKSKSHEIVIDSDAVIVKVPETEQQQETHEISNSFIPNNLKMV